MSSDLTSAQSEAFHNRGNTAASASSEKMSLATTNRKNFFLAMKRNRAQTSDLDEFPPHVKALAELPTPDFGEYNNLIPMIDVPQQYKSAQQTMKFSKGALLLLRLQNFQISEDSIYRFEPNLNLVLGGNGTGKSAIINAIFLLFLGNLSDLKQSDYGNFVQYGKDWGTVTALIQGSSDIYDGQNVMLSMRIKAKNTQGFRGRKTAPCWYINRSEVSPEDVWRLMCEMNIKVNNLCQFLPQFRVAAFSGESAQERLFSTEEAIGYNGMIDDHKYLAMNGGRLDEISKAIQEARLEINVLKQNQQELKNKENALISTRQSEEELAVLERVLDIKRYYDTEEKLEGLREELAKAQDDLQAYLVQTEVHSLFLRDNMERIRNLEGETRKLVDDLSTYHRLFKAYSSGIRHTRDVFEDSLMRVKKSYEKRNSYRRTLKKLQDSKTELEVEIKDLNSKITTEGSPSLEEYHEKLNRLKVVQEKVQKNAEVSRKLSSEIDKLNVSISEAKYSLNRSQIELKKVRDASKARNPIEVSKVLRYDRGSIEACVDLYRREKSKFHNAVIPPAILCLKIMDNRVVNMISSLTQDMWVQRFICLSNEDYILFTNLAQRDRKTRLLATFLKKQPPEGLFANKEGLLHSMGFEGVITDQLSGPEPMIDYFKTHNFHNIPYSLRPLTSNQVHQMRNFFESLSTSTLRFVDSENVYTLSRSRFGKRNITLETEKVKGSSAWAKFMLFKDTNAKQRELERRIEERSTSVTESEDLRERAAQRQKEINDTTQQDRSIERNIRDDVKDEQIMRQKHTRLLRDLEDIQKKIGSVESLINSEDFERLLISLAQAAEDSAKIDIPSPNDLLYQLKSGSISEEMIASRKTEYQMLIDSIENLINSVRLRLESNIKKTEKEIRDYQNHYHDSYEKYDVAIGWLRAQNRGVLKKATEKARDKTEHEIQLEIKQITAKITLSRSADTLDSVKESLDITNKRLEHLEEQLEANTGRENMLSTKIASTKKKYVAALESMIPSVNERFSEMFKKAGCRGSVTLFKEDETRFSSWGIDINVAFRENEPLTKLSRMRQSGGERAITTAFYLIALQDRAHSPFRVLDEINQGMDEPNERITMKFLVDFSCRNTSKAQQYFVVTPKLIDNLHTNPRMNVLYIFGGTSVDHSRNVIPSDKVSDISSALEYVVESNIL